MKVFASWYDFAKEITEIAGISNVQSLRLKQKIIPLLQHDHFTVCLINPKLGSKFNIVYSSLERQPERMYCKLKDNNN